MTNSDLVKQEDIKVMFSNIHLILPLNQVRTLFTRLRTTAVCDYYYYYYYYYYFEPMG